MIIQVKQELSKTRNPTEHGYELQGQKGEIIQTLDDGYNLIRFDEFKIKKQVTIKRKTQWIQVPLEWYVHDTDFHLDMIAKK